MGGIFGKRKKLEETTNNGNAQTCPDRPKKRNKTLNMSQQSEAQDNKNNDSVDANLKVPDSLSDINNQIIDSPPVRPPRKNKYKNAKYEFLNITNISELQGENIIDYSKMQKEPVEEPIIVPKKEPIHICDGTHHHAINVYNGHVIHAHAEIKPNITAKVNYVKTEVQNVSHVKPKHSTVSLPDFDGLNKTKKVIDESKSKKPPMRNISVISLPTESKITLSDATAARLENYMMRCKSFSDLPPRQLLDRLQDYHSDSEDSWDEINDWGIEAITSEGVPLKSPVEPRCKLRSPTAARAQMKTEFHPPVVKHEFKNTPISHLKNITERRESIDDFFDSKASDPYVPCSTPEPELRISLGRRGSDAFFSDTPKHPEKDSLSSNIYFTKALLQSESNHLPIQKKLEKKNEEPKMNEAAIGKNNDEASDLLETFKEFYDRKESTQDTNETENDDKTISTDITHSNLLKIIQENSPQEMENGGKSISTDLRDNDIKFCISEPLRSALVDIDEKINKIDKESKT